MPRFSVCGPTLAPMATTMTTRITKFENDERRTTLQVEGALHAADAEVLEKTFSKVRAQHDHEIEIDLSNVTFLDTAGAAVLCRLQTLGAELIGLHFFTRKLIEIAQDSTE